MIEEKSHSHATKRNSTEWRRTLSTFLSDFQCGGKSVCFAFGLSLSFLAIVSCLDQVLLHLPLYIFQAIPMPFYP
jgi:hypothetical protein